MSHLLVYKWSRKPVLILIRSFAAVVLNNQHITKSSWENKFTANVSPYTMGCMKPCCFRRHAGQQLFVLLPLKAKTRSSSGWWLRGVKNCAFKAAWETKPQIDFLQSVARWCDTRIVAHSVTRVGLHQRDTSYRLRQCKVQISLV